MIDDPAPECIALGPAPAADPHDPDGDLRARLRAMIDRDMARFDPPAPVQSLTFIDEVQS